MIEYWLPGTKQKGHQIRNLPQLSSRNDLDAEPSVGNLYRHIMQGHPQATTGNRQQQGPKIGSIEGQQSWRI